MNNQTATGGLTAIARDPQTIFVYWNPGSFGADKFSGKPGSNVRAIIGWRLKLASADRQVRREIEIDPAVGKYYFNSLIPGLTYEISLCLIDTMTEEHTVGRCLPVTLPSGNFSAESSAGWEVSERELVALLGEEGRKYAGSSGHSPRSFSA
jgi:hypothetical protein